MKTADIKPGVEYAMADDHAWRGGYRGREAQKATQVLVIDTGVERVKETVRFSGTTTRKTNDGVRVQDVRADKVHTVPSRMIREPWDEFAARRDATRQAAAQKLAAAQVAAAAVTDRITGALPAGFEVPAGAVPTTPASARSGALPSTRPALASFSDLASLLEAAVEHGRALGRAEQPS